MTQCHLDHIVIAVNEPHALDVYRAICGGEAAAHTSRDGTARYTRYYLGDAVVELAQPLAHPTQG